MKSSIAGTHVIALLPTVLEQDLRRHLEVLGVQAKFVHSSAELSHLTRDEQSFEVAIVPSDPPPGEWLSLCQELKCLNPRPSILVSYKEDTFTAWSQVLDAGGFGLLIEPYTSEGLQKAIEAAVDDFHKNPLSDT